LTTNHERVILVEFIKAPSRIVSIDTMGWSLFIFFFYVSS